MKRLLALVLAIGLCAGSIGADSFRAPKGTAGKVWGSTLALYAARTEKALFVCTAEPYEKIPGGYRIMSAGHCVQELPGGLSFSVADEIGSPRTPVTVIKAYDGDGLDFAIFEMKTNKQYSVLKLDTKLDLRVGDAVVNPNFALGLGKQLSKGYISATNLPEGRMCDGTCVGSFLVQMFGAGGSSGSAVISERTGKVIGLTVGQWDDNVGLGIEPISRFAKFLAGPGQPHPSEDPDGVQ